MDTKLKTPDENGLRNAESGKNGVILGISELNSKAKQNGLVSEVHRSQFSRSQAQARVASVVCSLSTEVTALIVRGFCHDRRSPSVSQESSPLHLLKPYEQHFTS